MLAAPHGFELGQMIAQSDASEVFVVTAERNAHLCKRLSPRAREDDGAREAAIREADILRHLAGRGAPRLVGSGQDAHGPFLVMERVPGSALLHAWIDEGRAPAAEDVVRAARAAFCALALVHEAGVLHGDPSPRNVVFGPSSAALIDFGMGRYMHDPYVSSAFAGTALYASPEAARGEPLTEKSDVFALAATIVHACTLRAPRRARALAPLLLEAGTEPLGFAPDALPEALRAILSAAVHVDPGARPTARGVLDGVHG